MKCPHCGAKGDVKGTEDHFEVRGQWPDGHWPVRKCRACGGGMIVKPGLRGMRAKPIDHDLWERMEEMWGREFGPR